MPEFIKVFWSLAWGAISGPFRKQAAGDDGTVAAIEAMKSVVTETRTQASAANERADKLQARFDVLSDTMNSVKSKLADCEQKHKACEDKQAEMEKRLEDRLDAQRSAIQTVADKVDSIGTNGT